MRSQVHDIAQCVPGEGVAGNHIAITGSPSVAHSAFDVDGVLSESAAYAIAAMDGLGSAPGDDRSPRQIDLDHLLAYCTTHTAVDGAPVPAWADLSGVYEAQGGRHLQIHCNFEHHAAGVVRRLGCAADRQAVAAAIAERDVFELEAELIDDGMIGAAIRTLDEWEAHPHATATRSHPLMSVERLGDAAPSLPRGDGGLPTHDDSRLDGVRVLDCSRVLAGPVAGQMLARGGADVLRLGADHLPSIPVGVMSTGFDKRNASLDLRTPAGREAMDALLDDADVWIDAYRPGALAEHGFSPERAASRRPGIVIVQISAFDWDGPWARRRGFDSIVQSTTGVRWAGGVHAVDDRGEPTGSGPVGLPVQALDYATGFLAAGLGAQLVAHQRRVGGSWLGRVSLLRTRNWLVARGGPRPYRPASVPVDPRFLATVDSEFGRLTTVAPFVGTLGAPPRPLGSSAPDWLS